ncbi:MAG: type III-B CRISPR module RAMP protein Cmr1, partial [Deltaproteobacteria bacterium]
MLETLQVTLVTPAMIGGVERSSCDDPAIVRPPAIRGMLHFWTRALCDKDHYREVEVDLWGSTERGQGISISTRQSPCQREERPLFPHHQGGRRVETTMMLPNPKPIELRFRLLHGQHREKLQAVVWTWLHLGSVGRRARRGYGSLLWHPR